MRKKNREPEHTTSLNRRQFLTQSGALGVALTSSSPIDSLLRAGTLQIQPEGRPLEQDFNMLKELFVNPPSSARPMTRWWWFGGAATPEEISRELELMRDAGLRGVELQPVYPLEVDDAQRGIHNVPYFSNEWFDLIRHTARETRRLGMQFDLTPGSGWPYGGPFIPVELAARKLLYFSQDVIGPREFRWDLHPLIPDFSNLVAALAAPLTSTGEVEMGPTKVITTQGRHWDVPPGHWRIMVLLDAPTLMQVKRPTVGMEGYVLDHFNREALEVFLDSVCNRTLRELEAAGLPPFASLFCDSLEVYGADWTTNLLKEFRERRGYDLAPYLPALWQEAGPLTPHVRYDYHLTLSELIVNNFFRPLADWCRKNGTTSRIQAHGAMGDVMQGYSLADIPEGERIEGGDRYFVDIAHRRLASSSGHLFQKPVISAETYTWLRHPLFVATLEMMKCATDSQFLDGINQIVNSGYPYSPPQAGRPGWVFYASCIINHNNIWWRHYPYLTRYIQRVAAMLQQGVSVNPIAVYLPLADVYAKFGAGGLNIDEEMERYLGTEFFLQLRRAGYDFDFINDDALARIIKVGDGKLLGGTGVYSAVIITSTEFMPPESLERLVEFVKGGGLLILLGKGPSKAPGVVDQDARTSRLQDMLNALFLDSPKRKGQVLPFGKGKAYRASDASDAITRLQEQIPPDFEILDSDERDATATQRARANVGFVHRRIGSSDLYFLSNLSNYQQYLRVRFAVGHRVPELWNPETGEIQQTLVFEFVNLGDGKLTATEVQLSLNPFESSFVVFAASERPPLVTRTNWQGPLKISRKGGWTEITGLVHRNGDFFVDDGQGRRHHFQAVGLPEPIQIQTRWRLKLENFNAHLTRLQSWTELPEGKTYSGWGSYETEFHMPDLGHEIEWKLDLGAVHETAEVSLNDQSLGAVWKGMRRLECGKALKPGRNYLKIDVGNLWINKVLSLPAPDLKQLAETYGIRWGMDDEKRPLKPFPSGLLGPVQLIPFIRRTERIPGVPA